MRKGPGIAAIALAALLLACAPAGPEDQPGGGPPREASTAPGSGGGPGGNDGTGRPGGGPASTAGTQPAGAPYDDDGGVGTMARTFLRASPAARLSVEIDYVEGFRPSDFAMSHVRDTLRDVCDKPGGVTVAAGNAVPAGTRTWSLAALRALERDHRSGRSRGDTATIWIAYVDGAFADDEGALGVAYGATSAVVFRERVDDATTALISGRTIERAVLMHEVGHLLALVNIGYRSAIDHEDPEHPKHSSNDESVMFWAVEDVSLESLLSGGPPATFDAADRADLEMLKK